MEQSVGKPSALWLGLVVPLYAVIWQEAQSVGVPANFPLMWQETQGVVWCRPVSGNLVKRL